MGISKNIRKAIISENIVRMKYLSIIFLAFAIFSVSMDFFIPQAWDSINVDSYLKMDILLFVLSAFIFTFSWTYPQKKWRILNVFINISSLTIVCWAAVLSSIDFSEYGLTTYISFLVLCILFLYLQPKLAFLLIWLSASLFLVISYFINGNNFISHFALIIPISLLSSAIAHKNYMDKVRFIEAIFKTNELMEQLGSSEAQLKIEVEKQTKDLIEANKDLEFSRQKLKLEKDRFAALIHNLQSGVFYIDIDGKILELNDALFPILGFASVEEIKTINILNFKPLQKFGYTQKLAQCIKNKEIIYGEGVYRTTKGKILFVHYYFVPIIEDNEVIGALANIDDISERKAMEEELIQAKEKAEESNRLKSAFLANMSHEIRTPMNGILGFLQLLEESDISDSERKEFIDIIKQSGERLINTINDIIEISTIESGKTTNYLVEIPIDDYILEHINFFSIETKMKGIDLSYKIDEKLKNKSIISDRKKLDSILANLLKNAIKYTDRGYIKINCQLIDQKIQVSIEDSGYGISKQDQKIIFDRFIKSKNKNNLNIEGSGLGLAISKAYVEELEGNIWVDSKIGIGSVFYFTINYVPVS